MANKNIVEAGRRTRFSSENQPKKSGRKPKLYTIAKDVYNIGKDDYRSVFFHLVQLNRKDLERVAKDDGQPIWVVNLARAILKDTGRGEYKTIDAMFEKFITERDVVCGNSATLVASIPERVLLELADRLQDEDYDKMASE